MLRSLARRTRVPALAALALAAAAVPAGASTVVGGKLDWTMDHYYLSGDPQRTWLGYVTNTVGGGAANGTATATGGATITDRSGAAVTEVTPASPAGLAEAYTFAWPASGGTYDEHSGVGSVQLGGTVAFTVHRLPVTIPNPTLTLSGLTASLTTAGLGAAGPYGAEAPVFTFDLAGSVVTLKADGTRIVEPIVRTSSNRAVFTAAYPPSQGTESFALQLKIKPDEVRGPQGPAGPAGPAGTQGKPGETIRLQTSLLKRAPFRGGRLHRGATLSSTKTGKTVASGSVRARTIRVTLAQDFTGKRLKGVYRLKVEGKAAKRVRVL